MNFGISLIKQFKNDLFLSLKEKRLVILKLFLNFIKNSIVTAFSFGRNYSTEIYYFQRKYLFEKKDPVSSWEKFRDYYKSLPKNVLTEIYKLKDFYKNEKLKLLEIGSGPVSNLAYYVDKDLFEVIAIDPLAGFYQKIMNKFNYEFPIKPISINCEDLLKFFRKETFHIIYAQNSIDHTNNPIICLNNAYHLLKNNGILFIRNNIKEGSRKGWIGLHKHDIYMSKNNLVHANQKGKITNFFKDDKINLDLFYLKNYLSKSDKIKLFEVVYIKRKQEKYEK